MRTHWNSPVISLFDKLRDRTGASRLHLCQVILSGVFFCLVTAPQPIFAQAKAKTEPQGNSAAELVAGLTETLTSIDSLYCEFTQIQKMDNEVLDSRRCRYARFGHQWHITEFSVADDKESEVGRTVCFDGERVYSYSVTKSPDGTALTGTVQVHDFQEPPLLSPEYMLGMRLPDLRKSIPAVCQENQVASVTAEAVDQEQLYRLMINSIPNGTTSEGKVYRYDVTCELDPEYGMLPSNIRVEFSPETKAFLESHRLWYQRWYNLEFRRIVDEYTGTERWFPVKGILEQGGVKKIPLFELSLENTRINANLEENLFNPRIPAGTTIFNMTAEGGGRVTLAGDTAAVDRKINELADHARATESDSFAYTWIIAVNIVFLALIAFVLWWVRKSKSR
ncbi:MAG: hypothetical protein CME33_14660 [Gimesia sp.]|uniref:hypothetical protein n=1 Tax=Gimesia sp. TaxID=2024833 RepID=UPI000C6B9170|nr:hypothetical protein [Gimesia sp.]MAX37796.1 hypothetical protein [Gimesia sp.]|tara:strand:+ start:8038 stop:9219 length:1182 start_codon:yes stop_codon:yes gene_type:complete